MAADFDDLYQSHYRRVFGLCLRLLGHRTQAEDAAQEVFVRAYRAFGRYDRGRPFAAWVLEIASNHCVDLIRRRSREDALAGDPEAELAALPADDAGALGALISAEQGGALRDAIDALPDRYRVPIVLAYYGDASYDDIAARMDITRNHVGVLLLRARQRLRQALTDQEAPDR